MSFRKLQNAIDSPTNWAQVLGVAAILISIVVIVFVYLLALGWLISFVVGLFGYDISIWAGMAIAVVINALFGSR